MLSDRGGSFLDAAGSDLCVNVDHAERGGGEYEEEFCITDGAGEDLSRAHATKSTVLSSD